MNGLVLLVVLLGIYGAGCVFLAWASPRDEDGKIIPARRAQEVPPPEPPARRRPPVDAAKGLSIVSAGGHVTAGSGPVGGPGPAASHPARRAHEARLSPGVPSLPARRLPPVGAAARESTALTGHDPAAGPGPGDEPGPAARHRS